MLTERYLVLGRPSCSFREPADSQLVWTNLAIASISPLQRRSATPQPAPPIDIEWKLLYVGDAKSEEYDQELDSCMGESSLHGPPVLSPPYHKLI